MFIDYSYALQSVSSAMECDQAMIHHEFLLRNQCGVYLPLRIDIIFFSMNHFLSKFHDSADLLCTFPMIQPLCIFYD